MHSTVSSVLPSMRKACRPNKPSVQTFLWCGNGRSIIALMWPVAPPKFCPPVMPWGEHWYPTPNLVFARSAWEHIQKQSRIHTYLYTHSQTMHRFQVHTCAHTLHTLASESFNCFRNPWIVLIARHLVKITLHCTQWWLIHTHTSMYIVHHACAGTSIWGESLYRQYTHFLCLCFQVTYPLWFQLLLTTTVT